MRLGNEVFMPKVLLPRTFSNLSRAYSARCWGVQTFPAPPTPALWDVDEVHPPRADKLNPQKLFHVILTWKGARRVQVASTMPPRPLSRLSNPPTTVNF